MTLYLVMGLLLGAAAAEATRNEAGHYTPWAAVAFVAVGITWPALVLLLALQVVISAGADRGRWPR